MSKKEQEEFYHGVKVAKKLLENKHSMKRDLEYLLFILDDESLTDEDKVYVMREKLENALKRMED